VKFLTRIKRFDFIVVLFVLLFGTSCVFLAYPLFLGPQKDAFVYFLLVYNFTIMLLLLYREQRKNMK
jgi:hypothetical protein